MTRAQALGARVPGRRWRALVAAAVSLVGAASISAASISVWAPPAAAAARPALGERCPWVLASERHQASPGTLAHEVLGRMTLLEKVRFVILSAGPGVENINAGVPALCIPPLTLSDGPNGISNHTPGSLQLPAALALAATFDPGLAEQYGRVMGEEDRVKGIDVAQAPEVNLARVPVSGRIFEAFGEDPTLSADLAVAEVRGIQSTGVLADVKHFSAYNQETARPRLREVISARALAELYDAPFRAAVEIGHAASIMCAYGAVNGVNDCSDPALFRALRRWHFTGFVRSDLRTVRSPAAAFRAGLDLIKPEHAGPLAALVRSGALPLRSLNHATFVVLRTMFAAGLVAHPRPLVPRTPAITGRGLALALQVAERSMVLLKDRNGALPLSRRLSSLAVIGLDAAADPRSAGFGSAYVPSSAVISPLAGLRAALPETRILVAAGGVPLQHVVPLTSADLASGRAPHGDPDGVSPVEPGKSDLGVVTADNVRRSVLTATVPGSGPGWKTWGAVLDVERSGLYELSVLQDGDVFVNLAGRRVLTIPGLHGPSTWATTVHLVAGHRYHLAMRWFAIAKAPVPRLGLQDVSPLIAAAARAARRAQVAVVFASDFNMEGVDRPSLSLPGDANALIAAVAAANPRTIVVLNTGGAVLMPWLKSVRAVLEAWYPGQVDGTATAAVLTGAVDPSGRLPLTFPRSQSVTPVAQPARYPGIAGVVTYSEGLNIGYRWYLATHHRPLFIFGSGLSYTRFRLGHAHLSRRPGEVVATVSVANTGAVSGTDVVQAYLADPRRAGEPPEQLRAFARVTLAPGTRRRVRLVLGRAAFAADLGGRWQVVPGTYRIGIGANAGDLAIELATRAPRPAPARRARMHRARRSQPYPPRHRRPLGQRPRQHHPLRHRPPARFGRTARPRPGGAARGTRR